MLVRFLKVFVFVIGMSLLAVPAAQAAYIDPNTGGIIFQWIAIAIGAISGMLLLFSGQIKRFIYRMRRSMRGSEPEEGAEDKPDDQQES